MTAPGACDGMRPRRRGSASPAAVRGVCRRCRASNCRPRSRPVRAPGSPCSPKEKSERGARALCVRRRSSESRPGVLCVTVDGGRPVRRHETCGTERPSTRDEASTSIRQAADPAVPNGPKTRPALRLIRACRVLRTEKSRGPANRCGDVARRPPSCQRRKNRRDGARPQGRPTEYKINVQRVGRFLRGDTRGGTHTSRPGAGCDRGRR